MSKSEYTANVQGFKCMPMQRKAVVARHEGMNVFHVIGYIALACVLAGCYF